jgi:uncharacterized repeat protein (TIGR01451 family)
MVARPGLAGLQTNTAVVASSVYDNNLTNNTATTTTLVASGPVGADLSVTVTDHPDPIIQGQNVTYTVTVRNAGPAPAANTKVTNTFSAAIAEVNLGPGCVLVGNTVICSLGTVATNGQKTVSFTVQALEAGTLTNGVLAWSDEVDASPANNTAVATTVVETSLRADLGVSVQDFPDPVIAGGMFTNVITLTNPGWSNAPNVMLTNRLTGPLAIQNIRVGAGVGYTNLGGGVVVFALGTLPAGSNAVVVIEALALGVGGATNAATVGTDILDPNPANNYSLTLTRINPTPVADLVTTITATPESAYGTFPLLYAIKVENAGTLAAGGVVLTNWIPSQVTVTGITNRHGSYTNQGKLLVCQLGTLPVGGSATVLVQVVTPPEGSLTNLAVAFAPQNDYNAADNLATLTTVVVPVTAADLSLSATVQSSNLYAGDEMTVRLSLVNNGPLGATGVVITNYPPAGTTFLRGTVTRGSLSFTTNAVVITVGSLTNGGSVQASLVMRANRDGALTNLAVARGGQPDPTPNAVATVIQVRPSADVRVSVVESADPVPSQGVLVYTITAFNAGPSTASNATIYCSLPPTAQFKGSFPVAGVSSGNGLVLWNAGPIASGGSVTLAVNITPGEVSQINVPMGVYSDARDPVATNNSVVVQTTVSVSLAGSSITVTPNDSAMALAAALTGPDVVGIRINDATLLGHSLPGGEGEEDALSSGVFNSTSIYGSGQNLSGVILSTGDVADYASGPNSKPDNGTAYDQAADSDQENFLDPITSGEEPGFDHFDVTQFDLNFDVLPGYDRITFKVVFGSEEFPASESRTFADGFGVYLDYRNIATPGGSAITSAHPDMAERAGTELNGVLVEDGSQVVMTFTAPVVPGTTGHRLTFILGDTSDADLDSTVYISSLQGLPGAKADVTLGATAAPEPASVGAPLTYTLLATNLGPGAASGTVLTGQLPDIFTNVTATVPPGSTYTYNKGVFTWNVGSLAAQGGAVATLTGKPRMEARVLADFAIQAGSVDSNTNNNKVQVFSTVAGTGSFYSPSALTIRDGAAALPYPSSITIFGLTGVVDTVTVSLLGLYHSFPADVQAMVMSPDGRAVLLMAGAGGGQDAQSVTLQFADSATNSLPLDEPLASGSFKPTNLAANNQFPGFTPQTMPPLAGELAHFRRANPNGDWRLYLYDAQGGDAGQLAGGWNIKLTTVPEMTLAVAGSNSVISWQDMPGYTLEGTAVLSSNPAWTTVTQNQVVANGRRTVVVPMSSGLKFFRLRQ